MPKPSISHLIEALSPSPLAYKHLRKVLINEILRILIKILISRLTSCLTRLRQACRLRCTSCDRL
ncbi:uncharacterized protein BDZ99DRAFT_466392 [Mytilinidion resinicola]|uniref:Uncharacterized protein n=1 Tax=Mytilinidion resinicola TaxID=574789 RepID=A0A6A6YBP7_9PEZI|nr:uncharacterized protein BDZ99DRAFT_466392 [Mytilinidion resinicola]KAF2806120.1 hypothetical protein BDZ99DRAFT_466392 [Mytilinidion resinicola]